MKNRLLAAILLLFSAAAHAEAVVKSTAPTPFGTTEPAYILLDKDLAAVRFEPGSSTLAQAEKAKLAALVADATAAAPVDRYIVTAWSDQDYPDKGARLSTEQRRLADDRRDTVVRLLGVLGAKPLDSYSMATQPSWIARAFGTQSAVIKGAKDPAKARQRLTSEIGAKLRARGGPGMAVVVVRYKGEVSAH